MSVEKKIKATSGWGILGIVLVAFVAIIAMFILSIVGLVNADEASKTANPLLIWGLGLSIFAFCLIWVPACGFFTLQPGQARVCILFGDYKGTVRDEGFRWANPFYSRSRAKSWCKRPAARPRRCRRGAAADAEKLQNSEGTCAYAVYGRYLYLRV